jgi:hypothetical protein
MPSGWGRLIITVTATYSSNGARDSQKTILKVQGMNKDYPKLQGTVIYATSGPPGSGRDRREAGLGPAPESPDFKSQLCSLLERNPTK